MNVETICTLKNKFRWTGFLTYKNAKKANKYEWKLKRKKNYVHFLMTWPLRFSDLPSPLSDFCTRYRHRFFIMLGTKPRLAQITYASIVNKHFFTKWCHLPKLWTEPTKIGHIFRKYSTLKIGFQKNSHLKVVLLLSQILILIQKFSDDLWCWKRLWKSVFGNLFKVVVHNFVISDIIYF